MPQQQQKVKGNPAHHRMSNTHLKAYRESCWAKQEKRKEERRQEGKARHLKNLQLRALGEPTPWQQAKTERYARRHQSEIGTRKVAAAL